MIYLSDHFLSPIKELIIAVEIILCQISIFGQLSYKCCKTILFEVNEVTFISTLILPNFTSQELSHSSYTNVPKSLTCLRNKLNIQVVCVGRMK